MPSLAWRKRQRAPGRLRLHFVRRRTEGGATHAPARPGKQHAGSAVSVVAGSAAAA
jgi:hypothetical protein